MRENQAHCGMTKKLRVLSLFAGIGGFDLGFERAGFQIVGHVEIDRHCQNLLSNKWPDVPIVPDVCEASRHNLPECDVVTFGFPCQDLSVAGKRAGLSGERSGLFYEAMRIIDELKPAWAVWENVPGLLSSDSGRDLARVIVRLAQSGYFGCIRCLDAQWFGVAQRRRRLFGVFSRLNSGAERAAKILSLAESLRGHPAPSREARETVSHDTTPCLRASGTGTGSVGDIEGQDAVVAVPEVVCGSLSDGAHHGGGMNSQDAYTGRVIPAVAWALQERDAKGADSDTKAGHLIIDDTGTIAFQRSELRLRGTLTELDVAPTLKAETKSGDTEVNVAQVQWASGGGKVENETAQALRSGAEHNYQFARVGMAVRRLTPTECERLQGFPDGWTAGFSDSARYRMLGNAVCVPVAEWIARRLKDATNSPPTFAQDASRGGDQRLGMG